MKSICLFLFLFILNLNLDAEDMIEEQRQNQSSYENNYFVQAARHYELNPALLYAIAKTESSLNTSAINCANKNQSCDYGIMQINSIHLPMLAKHNIFKKDLFNPKVNIFVGAWVLKNCINKHGLNYKAINCYNGRIKNNNYYEKVLKNYYRSNPDYMSTN